MAIEITSTAFKEGDDIPTQFTCDGQNISPPLTWSGVPQETQTLALLMNDPDAPNGTFTHWVMYNVPRDLDSLPDSVANNETLDNGARQAKNSFGNIGYGGPCPPPGHGSHRYFFHVYALDTELSLNSGATADDFLNAIDGHIIAEGQLMGRYERQQAKATKG
ncbi:MAG TPA: YbhB/YbcL family Raf kinase inhibitor-like protein [Pyrinomonadaceae bacterium]|nr:YbhB/YbcL family Raf kinase inhibitor-like protein [Pyrinomonadaceae bacterium]